MWSLGKLRALGDHEVRWFLRESLGDDHEQQDHIGPRADPLSAFGPDET
jgi:hypothetical protein